METTNFNYIVTFRQEVYNDESYNELLETTFKVLACFSDKKDAIRYAEKFYINSSENAWKKSSENKKGEFNYQLGDKTIINNSIYFSYVDVVRKQVDVATNIEEDITNVFR